MGIWPFKGRAGKTVAGFTNHLKRRVVAKIKNMGVGTINAS